MPEEEGPACSMACQGRGQAPKVWLRNLLYQDDSESDYTQDQVGKGWQNLQPRSSFHCNNATIMLALGRVLFGSCCEVALPIFAGWTYKVHCPASTAKSKTATSWSSISQRLSFQCRLSVWGLTTTAFLEGCFSATIGSQDNMRVSSMRLSI